MISIKRYDYKIVKLNTKFLIYNILIFYNIKILILFNSKYGNFIKCNEKINGF